jgi:hypothetical protein
MRLEVFSTLIVSVGLLILATLGVRGVIVVSAAGAVGSVGFVGLFCAVALWSAETRLQRLERTLSERGRT